MNEAVTGHAFVVWRCGKTRNLLPNSANTSMRGSHHQQQLLSCQQHTCGAIPLHSGEAFPAHLCTERHLLWSSGSTQPHAPAAGVTLKERLISITSWLDSTLITTDATAEKLIISGTIKPSFRADVSMSETEYLIQKHDKAEKNNNED